MSEAQKLYEHLEEEVPSIQKETDELRASDEDLMAEAKPRLGSDKQPASSTKPTTKVSGSAALANSRPFTFVPLRMGGNGGTHVVSEGSRRLIEEEVTLEDLEKMTNLFYDKAFQDPTLDKFIRTHDDPHGARFAKWIHQKLSGSTVWDEERRSRNLRPVQLARGIQHVVHDRSSAHAAAWYSPKRPANEVGRHFKLDECRVWMRLHFWALRESALLEKSPSFADYYVRFIGHFVRVYESSAPAFARDSLRWSEDPANIQTYLSNGCRMIDVLGLSLEAAEAQIPEAEVNDFEWPYNQSPPAEAQ